MTYNFNNVEQAFGLNNVELSKIYGSGDYLLWEKPIPWDGYLRIDVLNNNANNNAVNPLIIAFAGNVDITISYKLNNDEWKSLRTLDENNYFYVSPGDVVLFRNNNADYNGSYIRTSCYCNVSGHLSSIINASIDDTVSIGYASFFEFFSECLIVNARNLILPNNVNEWCYCNMFKDCTSLITAPSLPATTLSNYCYRSMFEGCTNLISAPIISATTLAKSCCYKMFRNCSSLITAPSLPATTLAEGCYEYMFYGCTSLITAPSLPATTLADSCYFEMFYSCTSLTSAPDLLATTLALACYQGMFALCNNLNYIKCLATNNVNENNTFQWAYNVSQTGTFVKANGVTWPTGNDGIPTGWTVQEV